MATEPVQTGEDAVLLTADGVKYLPPHREAAWLGLLQAHAALTRGLDHELSVRHGLTLSAYEVLSRTTRGRDGSLRMTELAAQAHLSLSRVSRITDQLQARGLLERRSCETDSRVVYAAVTEEGRRVLAEAQETFFAAIEERFLGRLSCDEVRQLGTLLSRLTDGATC